MNATFPLRLGPAPSTEMIRPRPYSGWSTDAPGRKASRSPAGDDAAVPDLASGVPGALTVPNAQHAVRQGKRLAANIVASLRGERTRDYVHHSLGVVATLGLGKGIFQWRGIVITGFLAWVMHRGYHVLAIPTWERKVRVLLVWATAVLFGRDIVSLLSVQHPRRAFLGKEPDADAVGGGRLVDAGVR